MTVLVNRARMAEIVQIKWMISTVIVSPDMQGKIVQSVRNIAFIIDILKPSRLVLSSVFWTFFKSFLCLMFCVDFN